MTLLVLTFSVLHINAQCDLPYRPLAEFDKDTTAFLMYNFRDRADCYTGKTLKEVTADLQIPIKDYIISNNMRNAQNAVGIYIYMYPSRTVKKFKDNERETNNIEIIWEEETNLEKEFDIRKAYRKDGWNRNIYEHYKDMKIKKIQAVVYDYSKYFEKYNPSELRSTESSKRKVIEHEDGSFTITRRCR